MPKKQIPKIIPPSVDTNEGIKLLNLLIKKAELCLAEKHITVDMDETWDAFAENYLIMIFGSDSPNVTKVLDAGRVGSFSMSASEQWWESKRREGFISRVAMLNTLIEVLETNIVFSSAALSAQQNQGNKVFIVHGQNHGTKETVARFVEKIGLDVVILHEKANGGRTIIEKFESECEQVGFAIVIMTADDRGGSNLDTYELQTPRARQNVVLELGFFLGRIGRGRVAVLHEDNVEIPSDYSGVLFIKIDPEGSWRMHLAREIKSAGFSIDMNLAV